MRKVETPRHAAEHKITLRLFDGEFAPIAAAARAAGKSVATFVRETLLAKVGGGA